MTDSASRRRLFSLIALSLPVLFFVGLEGLLRATGFGEDYPLFVEFAARPQYLQPNPDVINRFFAHPGAAPDVSIDSGFFLAQKPADGLRIVVQGGSSAAGFPYGKHASLAGMLQQRLQRSFPRRTVEVVQTAMAAVNSYTLREFADEIVAVNPDAVLIYAGHNEFVGVLGVGSALGGGRSVRLTHARLALRDWRVYQLLQRAVGALRPTPAARSGTLMANIARERSIELDSPLFHRGVEQFEANLDALLARYARAGITVFIGTLASNEKDQAPFHGEPLAAPADWNERVRVIHQALDAGDIPTAMVTAADLAVTAPDAATAHFLLGRAALAAGDVPAARESFGAALDRDRLRFRAPRIFQQVIRETAARHGAHVVPSYERLANASPHGIIGAELMLEHLHPNHNGYFLLADAFYDALAANGLGLPWRRIDSAQARAEQPLTELERLHGEYRVAGLMNDWPFVPVKRAWQPAAPTTEYERIAQAWLAGSLDWIGAMNQALLHAQQSGDFTEASRIATSLADAFPFEAQPQHVAGQMLIRQTPPAGQRALPYFHRAATLAPGSVEFLVTLTRAYWINGYPDQARATAQRLMQVAPGHPAGPGLMQLMDQATDDASEDHEK